MIQKILNPDREFNYFENDDEFYRVAKTSRSNCVLNVNKLATLGLPMRPVQDALKEAMEKWVPTNDAPLRNQSDF